MTMTMKRYPVEPITHVVKKILYRENVKAFSDTWNNFDGRLSGFSACGSQVQSNENRTNSNNAIKILNSDISVTHRKGAASQRYRE